MMTQASNKTSPLRKCSAIIICAASWSLALWCFGTFLQMGIQPDSALLFIPVLVLGLPTTFIINIMFFLVTSMLDLHHVEGTWAYAIVSSLSFLIQWHFIAYLLWRSKRR